MNLFNRKTLSRQIKPATIPADHLSILEAWAGMIRTGRIIPLREVELHSEFKSNIAQRFSGTLERRRMPNTQ